MKYKATIKLKQVKAVVQLKRKTFAAKVSKKKSVFKVPREIIVKLKILEELEGSYFSDNLVKTLKGEYFS